MAHRLLSCRFVPVDIGSTRCARLPCGPCGTGWCATRDSGLAASKSLANRVEYVLEPIPIGTRLTVIHSGLGADPEAFSVYERGWAEVLLKLVTWLLAAAPLLGLSASGDSRE